MNRCALYLNEKAVEKELRRLAEEKQLQVVETYQETSADSTVVLNQMLAASRRHPSPFQTVIVNNWLELGKVSAEGLIYKALLEKQGLSTYSVAFLPNDGSVELLGGLVKIIDRYYLSSISAGTIKGMKKNIADHNENGGKPPYGYSHSKVVVGFADGKEIIKTRLQLNSNEADEVEKMFELYLAGKSYDEIAGHLNERGVPPRSAARWRKSSVRAILVNPVYYGCRIWNQIDKKNKGRRLKPESEWIVLENNHDPIINKETFHEAQTLRKQRWSKKKTSLDDYALGHFMRCGLCQRSLMPSFDGLATFWLCEAARGRQDNCTNKGLISNQNLEKRLLRVLRENFFIPQKVRRVAEWFNLPASGSRQLLKLMQKLLGEGTLIEKRELWGDFVKEIQLFDEELSVRFRPAHVPLMIIPLKKRTAV